jgi:hypothetical protein
MNPVEVTIHPQGWLFVAAVMLGLFLWGYMEGWTARRKIADKEKEEITFDFERKQSLK